MSGEVISPKSKTHFGLAKQNTPHIQLVYIISPFYMANWLVTYLHAIKAKRSFFIVFGGTLIEWIYSSPQEEVGV